MGAECKAQGGEMFPTQAVDWQASAVRGKEVRRFSKSSW